MTKAKKNLLYTPHVSPIWIVVASMFWAAALYFFSQTRIAQEFEVRVAKSFDHRVREALGRSPKLHPRVKIFGFDDKVLGRLGRATLTPDEWTRLLTSMDALNPSAIVIDAMFSLDEPDLLRNVDGIQKTMAALKAPVIIGAFVSNITVTGGREALDLTKPDYSPQRWFSGSELDESDLAFVNDKKLRRYEAKYIYGPGKISRTLFKHVGHFLYDGDSVFMPLLVAKDNKSVLPYFGLLTDAGAKVENGQLRVHGNVVPIDENGQVHINFSSKSDYFGAEGRVRSLWRMLEDSRKTSTTLDGVAEGDIVLIIPMMYTGNTDFKMTPMGYVPGGLVHATIISNALSGAWLKPIQGKPLIVAVACVIGAIVGAANGPLAFAALMLTLQLVWFGLCAYLFVFHNIVTAGHIPALGFLLAAATVFTERMRVAEKKRLVLKTALDGLISPRNLREMARNPDAGVLEAREEVITVMFIDVVGFSLISENQVPRLAFDSLKTLINDLAAEVHAHGGVVNKTLGDGLLCCFGKIFDDGAAHADHAEQAVRCAIAIQKTNLLHNVQAADVGESIYPLRVGINTASIFLGDLGTGDRIDISVVGNGVNFAKRLEGACDMHSILLSKTTKDLLSPHILHEAGLKRKLINIKHHTELIEAFEYDPFHAQTELRQKATQLFRHYASLARVEDRWTLSPEENVALVTNVGRGELIDFSSTGLRVKLPELMVRGSIIYIDLDASDPTVLQQLHAENLQRVQAEVRWSYADKDTNIHGLVFRDIAADRCERLIRILRKVAVVAATIGLVGCVSLPGTAREFVPDTAYTYLSWDELLHDDGLATATRVNYAARRVALIREDPRLTKLHPRIRGDAVLSRLVLTRGLEEPVPFDQGAVGKADDALFFVADAAKVPSTERLYWTMVKALSERYGCFMRQKVRKADVFQFRCRDGRRVVFWRRYSRDSAEFYARQFDAQGRELIVDDHKIVMRRSNGLSEALARSEFVSNDVQ